MSWRERFEARGSALCIGLDPVAARLPAGLGLFDFCAEVIELTAEWAACYKPNVAFFEREGPAGVEAFAKLLALLRERGIPSIADVKRG
ncbi:MAG: orotidine 5'-phosphate decarboxylase, partial [Planctomycetota bacterium]|nr:orotidine 5'-phosphate decarboxylase [Planctomycetota bacterium]